VAGEAILALDQGTTNTKAVLVALDGEILRSSSFPTLVLHPQPGWAEQSGAAIRDSAERAIAAVAEGLPRDAILAIGISNQRETALAWDADGGAPIGPSILWQCRRSSVLCAQLRAQGHEEFIRSRSGLGLDPLFSAGKLRWLLDNVPEARPLLALGKLRMGTVDSWLLWNLTGGKVHATDASNASRTQLMALDKVAWDPVLLEQFGVPATVLPQIHASDHRFGVTLGGFAGLADGIPINGVLGDSHAALFGHGIAGPGSAKVTLGTGSSLMCPTGKRTTSGHGLSETVAWAAEGVVVYALEGNIAVSGQAAAFAGAILGIEDPQALTRLAMTVPDSGGVQFVPALAGLGAPHWRDVARGVLCGLSLATTPAHIARAALEGIAHQICDVLEAIEADLGRPVESIAVDGGGAENDMLLHMLADLSDRIVQRPSQSALSAIGAALMAANGIGKRITSSIFVRDREFRPATGLEERETRRAEWKRAVRRAALET
jgi:glycerol kinase